MSILKRLKLGTKIVVGFGSLILILLITNLFGYSGLNNISKDFSHYRKIANNNVLAGKIEENLLNNQINFKDFIVTGESSAQKEFEKQFRIMEELIMEAKENIEDSEREKDINSILDYTKEYKEGFVEIVDYQENRDALVQDSLTILGNEMEANLSELMTLLFEEKNESMIYSAAEVQKNLLLARLNVMKYLEDTENDDKFSEDAFKYFSEMDKSLKYLDDELESTKGRGMIQEIVNNKEIYVRDYKEVISLISSRNTLIDKLNDLGSKISDTAEEIKLSIITDQDDFGPKVKQTNSRTLSLLSALSFMAIVLSILISIGIIRMVVFPITTVTNTFKGISEGEADLKVRLNNNSNDEIGKMANYFNKFMEKLQIIMNESDKQNWLKTGQSELNEIIRGEQDIKSLSNNIITYVCKYLNAQVGAFYLNVEDNTYKMISSYAFTKRKNLSNEIKTGEGLVGQCALEKQTIVISNVPGDYITVNSGLGEAVPNNILVTPCLHHNDVKCIIELGSFHEITDVQYEFIEDISEIVAISINSAQARSKMQELLDKSLKQTEELQLQQEELRQTNEELQQQTMALKESESRLQEQQEELRVINEELEEQTQGLKKQRDEINIKNEELQKAQKDINEKAVDLELANQYKSEFLANMSHELRTPLNSILILSKLLADKDENTIVTEKDLEFAKTIHSSGYDLLSLINDILDLSKVEAGRMEINLENMNLSELAYDLERSFRQIAVEKGLEFSIDISEGLPDSIYTDQQRVKQILNNLMSNAFKFTESGGVTVSIERPTEDDEVNSIHGEKTIKIVVTDTGIGIPQDKQKIIFEAFKQSDGTISRKFGGTGLGLSISREFVKLLGGRIYLESDGHKGTTFTVILPERFYENSEASNKTDYKEKNRQHIKPTAEEEIAIAYDEVIDTNDDENTYQINEKNILIIEDDSHFSNILTELAKEKGFRCIEAKNGETGVKLAIEYKPKAIILDIGLPGIDGWEVVKRLKNNSITKDIPVHVISGYEDKNIDELRNGIVGYLSKPVSLDDINEIFGVIKNLGEKPFKNILIVEDNKNQRFSISELMSKQGAITTAVPDGKEAYNLLKNQAFDCMILDLGLRDMTGFNLLEILKQEDLLEIPVIIYTGKEITSEEEAELKKYAETIIVKGPRSMERLTSEVSLFLHSVDSRLSQKKRKIVKVNHVKEVGLSGKKILIVDDDMRNVFALTSVLEENNIDVIVGRNGKEGIDKLKENPDIDLVLMDIMMPEMDGYTAMGEIRKTEEYQNLPIIALTAKAMKEDRNKCIEAGANDYLTKPVDTDKLISLLRVWLY